MRVSPTTLFATLATIIVLAAIGVGFFLNGGPAEVRARRFDQQRVSDLLGISGAVRNYRLSHDSVPKTLETMQQGGGYAYVSLRDPETRVPYEYRTSGDSSFELCAQFETSVDEKSQPATPAFWNHPSGRHCFSLDAPARRQG